MKPLTAQELAEMQRTFGTVQPREFVSVPAGKLIALLDALDEAEARAKRAEADAEFWRGRCRAAERLENALAALAAEHGTKEDGDGE